MTGQTTHGAVVEFDHVSKSYDPAATKDGRNPGAVNDLSLKVPAGKICILVGPSGCGKTTSLKMVNRLIEPTSGKITIDGVDVTTQEVTDAAARDRLRHPAGRPVPAPDDRRERRDGAAPPRVAEGAPQRAIGGAARARRARAGQVPRPVPEPAVGRRTAARRRRPGPGRRPADHAHGRAVRRRRPDRPRPAPERIPPPPGIDRQDDPVRDPRHRRGDQDGRPRRRLPDRGRPGPVRQSPRHPRGPRVGVRGTIRRPGPRAQAAVAPPRLGHRAAARRRRPGPATAPPTGGDGRSTIRSAICC